MQGHENIVVGLDIGTTKICAVVGEVSNDDVNIIGIGTSPSIGLRKGVVVNIESTVESIKKVNRGFEIEWRVPHSPTINMLIDNEFRVIEGGFCMSVGDKMQSVSSVVNVLQDYIDNGDYIYITRS